MECWKIQIENGEMLNFIQMEYCRYTLIKVQFKMDFGEELKCNQCLALFSFDKIPLKMPNCHHNVCEECFQEVKNSQLDLIQCEFCGITLSQCKNQNLTLNNSLLKKVQKCGKKNQTGTDTSSFKMNSKFEDSFMLLGEDDPYLKRKKNTTLIRNQLAIQMCNVHKKSLEIICVNDLKRICSHCAIFGGHKNHKFKSFQEFNEDYEEKMKNLQILKQKRYKINRKHEFHIQSELQNKKRLLLEELQHQFEKILTTITNKKQKMKNDLDAIFMEQDQIVKEIIKGSENIENQFHFWESECENMLDKLNENISLNEKISIMYSPSLKIEKGEKILINIEKRLSELQNKADLNIKNVTLDFSEVNLNAKVNKSVNSQKKQVVPKLTFHQPQSPRFSNLFADDGENIKTPQKSEVRLRRCKSNLLLPFKNDQIQTEKKRNQEEDFLTNNPELICSQFLKKDLKDALDLSNCNLCDERVYECVKNVRKHKKIRGLKLCKNKITDKGFEKLISVCGSITNLNLSNNLLTEEILNLIVKNRDKLSPLRIINVSSNRFNERKAKAKVEALKKIGIIVTL